MQVLSKKLHDKLHYTFSLFLNWIMSKDFNITPILYDIHSEPYSTTDCSNDDEVGILINSSLGMHFSDSLSDSQSNSLSTTTNESNINIMVT